MGFVSEAWSLSMRVSVWRRAEGPGRDCKGVVAQKDKWDREDHSEWERDQPKRDTLYLFHEKRDTENSDSNSKTLILKDSSVRSIWTCLTASPCYATNTNKHDSTTNKYCKHDYRGWKAGMVLTHPWTKFDMYYLTTCACAMTNMT